MRKVSKKVRDQLISEPDICARRKDGGCDGSITWEHAVTFAGRQLDKAWAIIKICEYHHAVNKHQDGGDLDKEKNLHVALNRATDEELKEISKAKDYIKEKERLNAKYA